MITAKVKLCVIKIILKPLKMGSTPLMKALARRL